MSEPACVTELELSRQSSSQAIMSRTLGVSSWSLAHPVFLNIFGATFASPIPGPTSPCISARRDLSNLSSAKGGSGRASLRKARADFPYLRVLMWLPRSSQIRDRRPRTLVRAIFFFERYMISVAATRFALAPSRSSWFVKLPCSGAPSSRCTTDQCVSDTGDPCGVVSFQRNQMGVA